MAKRIMNTTPRQDGFRMPGEFENRRECGCSGLREMITGETARNRRRRLFANVAKAIADFEPVTVCVSASQYQNCRAKLPDHIRVVEMANDDAWIRDCGPTFVVNDRGEVRGVDWEFNAWGGLYDGLYFPWANDDQIGRKVCEIENIDSYRTDGFVLEGGSFHVDGEGTLLTTEMCLLSEGRNPHMDKSQIEKMLGDYLNIDKVIWIKDGIDPEETNGHIDDVACFVRPGEVACIWTEDESHPFYRGGAGGIPDAV